MSENGAAPREMLPAILRYPDEDNVAIAVRGNRRDVVGLDECPAETTTSTPRYHKMRRGDYLLLTDDWRHLFRIQRTWSGWEVWEITPQEPFATVGADGVIERCNRFLTLTALARGEAEVRKLERPSFLGYETREEAGGRALSYAERLRALTPEERLERACDLAGGYLRAVENAIKEARPYVRDRDVGELRLSLRFIVEEAREALRLLDEAQPDEVDSSPALDPITGEIIEDATEEEAPTPGGDVDFDALVRELDGEILG